MDGPPDFVDPSGLLRAPLRDTPKRMARHPELGSAGDVFVLYFGTPSRAPTDMEQEHAIRELAYVLAGVGCA